MGLYLSPSSRAFSVSFSSSCPVASFSFSPSWRDPSSPSCPCHLHHHWASYLSSFSSCRPCHWIHQAALKTHLSRVFFGGNGPIHWRTTCAQAYAGAIFCGRVLPRAYAASLLTRNASANALVFNLLASWMMKKRNLHLKKNWIPRCARSLLGVSSWLQLCASGRPRV